MTKTKTENSPDLSVWTTKEGQKTIVKEMTDSHLANVITYLQKRIERLTTVKDDNVVLRGIATVQIEGAQRWIDHLEAEQARRLSAESQIVAVVPFEERYV